jgi:hypothetical protein
MPIRRFLDGQPFDLDTIRLMGLAFETALASLGPTPDYADPVREVIAGKIIELAKAGERDPERVCDAALKDLRPVVTDPSPLPLPAAPPGAFGFFILSQSGERPER